MVARYPAKLIGADDLTDIAVIKITLARPLMPARWGNSNAAQVGDWVLAAGNPFALGNSFTVGIISAEGRDIGDGPFDHFLQLDAPINPGNSGGPAFNMAGPGNWHKFSNCLAFRRIGRDWICHSEQ